MIDLSAIAVPDRVVRIRVRLHHDWIETWAGLRGPGPMIPGHLDAAAYLASFGTPIA